MELTRRALLAGTAAVAAAVTLPVLAEQLPADESVVWLDPFGRIHEMTKHWCKEIVETVRHFDDCSGIHNLDEIETEHRDGFIPFTNGGWDGIAYADLGYAEGSGCPPKAVQPIIDSIKKGAEEDWDKEHPEHTVEWLYKYDPVELDQLHLFDVAKYGPSKRDKLLEEFQEHESAQFSEGCTYFYKARAIYYDNESHRNELGVPEVLFCVGINTDLEYGRDSIPWLSCYGGKTQQTEWLWEKNVPAADVTEELIATFIDQALEALRNA
jgi:hypothetical protein